MNFVIRFTGFLIIFSAPNIGIHIKNIPEVLLDVNRTNIYDCEIPCQYSGNPENPDAEFFMVMNDGDIQNAIDTKPSAPIRLIGGHEPAHYYHLMRLNFLKFHFQGTCFLNRHSDIPWTIMPNMDEVKLKEIQTQAQPKASFVARNCNPMNNRNDYVKAIDEVIGVASLGDCLHNTDWPQCDERPCTKVEALKGYKFHLAFENGYSQGFLTDRLYQAMEAGVIPVWMGTPEVTEAAPVGSYIDVADFGSPHGVANYLKKVLEDETLYSSYFEWKNKPFDVKFLEVNEVLWRDPFNCRACYYVDALKRGVEWDHLKQRARSDNPIIEVDHSNITVSSPPLCEIKTAQTNSYASYLFLSMLFTFVLLCLLLWKMRFRIFS